MGRHKGTVTSHVSHRSNGYYVEITRNGVRHNRYFALSKYDDPLERAVEWRNEKLMELDGKLPHDCLAAELRELTDATISGHRINDTRRVTGVAEQGDYTCVSLPWWGSLRSADFAVTLLKGYIDTGSKWKSPSGDVLRVVGEQMEPQRLERL